MSKVGILTFHNSNNHGAMLQAFALQETLSKLGNSVQIINYVSSLMPSAHNLSNSFLQFRDKYLNVSEKIEANRILSSYDKIVIGSDQVWNPELTGRDKTYFLYDEKNPYRVISYAASLGLGEKEIYDNRDFYYDVLSSYKYISVREDANINSINNVLSENKDLIVESHIDPTLLLSQEEYESRLHYKSSSSGVDIDSDFIFYFSYKHNPRLLDCANLISAYTHLPMVVGNNYHGVMYINGTKVATNLNPVQWLTLIDRSSLILTDSFHGLMFSLITHKPFYIGATDSPGVTRLIDVLKRYNLMDRRISELYNVKDINFNPDYSFFDSKVLLEKQKSFDYLKKYV